LQYLALLRQSEIVRILTFVQALAYFGSWFSHVAILTLLVELKASPFIISVAVAMMFLPALLQGAFVGTIIDRIEPKKLMNTLLFVESVCTVCFVFITAPEYIWLLLLLVYLKMSAAGMYFTSEMSLLPKILKSDELKLANEIHSIVWSVSFTVGVALGGLAVEFLGIKASFLIDASLFIIAVVVFSKLRLSSVVSKPTEGILDSFLAGLRYVFRQNPKLVPLMLLHATVGLTVFDALVTVLAEQKYKAELSVPLAIGFISATRSLALVIGPFVFSKLINKQSLFWMFLGQGIAIMIWGVLSHSFWFSLIGAFLCGMFTTTIWSYTMTLLQDAIDKKFYGRVVSINDMFFTAAATTTSFGIGALMGAGIAAQSVLLMLGVLFLAVAVLYRVKLKEFA
jgi:MFS transporter, DHA3 family, macrolide efflux protein